MPAPLTSAATIICGHGGAVTITPPAGKLRAQGTDVLTAADVVGAPIVGCGQVGPGLTPCTAVVSLTAGLATKLRRSGAPVLLDTLAGTTNGAPSNTLLAATAAGQAKLGAV